MNKPSLSYIATILLVTFLLGTVIGQAQTPTTVTFLQPGSLTETATFNVWADGPDYFAKDGETGQITETDTDIGALINTLKGLVGATGGTIFVKGGAYSQSTTITLGISNENLTIKGESFKTTTVFEIQSDIFSINITGSSSSILADHINIENLKIKPASGVTSTKAAIFLQYVGGSKFENLALDNMGYGIFADTGVTPNTISQCIFDSITVFEPEESGIVLQDTFDSRLTDIKVLDAKGSYGDSEAGIKLIHPNGGDVLDSCLTLNGAGHGVMLVENGHWTLLTSVISDTNEGHSIVLTEMEGTQIINSWGSSSQNVDTYGILIEGCNDTMITNSQFRTNGAHGIYVLNSSRTTIVGSMSITNGQESQGFGLSIAASNQTMVSASAMANRFAGGFNSTSQVKGIDEDSDSNYTNIVGVDTNDNLSNGITVAGTNWKVNSSWNSTVWVD